MNTGSNFGLEDVEFVEEKDDILTAQKFIGNEVHPKLEGI